MRKRILVTGGLLLVLIAIAGWWRMGKVLVEVDAEALAKLPPFRAPYEFSMVAYNVQARPFFDDSKHKFTFISDVLNAYDIVAVQECFKDYQRLWEGTRHPVRIYDASLKAPWKVVGSGLSMLARFPLISWAQHHYTTAGDFQNKPASKGILFLRLDIGGQPLDVYTTHMEAGKTPEAMVSRRQQAIELIGFVQEHSPLQHPLVLLGDFNMQPTKKADRLPESRMLQTPLDFSTFSQHQVFDALRLNLGLQRAAETLGIPPHKCVDHVLYRDGARARLEPRVWQRDAPAFYDPEGKPLSDHEPLIVRFRLELLPTEQKAPHP